MKKIILIIIIFCLSISKSISDSLMGYPSNLNLVCQCRYCDDKKQLIGILFNKDFVEKYESSYRENQLIKEYDINDFKEIETFPIQLGVNYELFLWKEIITVNVKKKSLIRKNKIVSFFQCNSVTKKEFFNKCKMVDYEIRNTLINKKVYNDYKH